MSTEKKGELTARSSRELSLRDGGSEAAKLIDQAFQNLTSEQRASIAEKAASKAIDLEVERRRLDDIYIRGKKSAEDHLDVFNAADKSGPLTRQSITSEIDTGAGKMKIQSKSGPACFVASAAFENPEHPDVVFLRRFRDEVLRSHAFGRAFISFYWIVGPKLAAVVTANTLLKLAARKGIGRFVSVLRVRLPKS